MAKNIDFMGATFPDVPSIRLPQHEGGLVSFTDVTDTTAVASDVASGKYFYTADGEKTVGTASGGITPSGTYSITSNGIYDIVSFASVDVNVSGGGGGITADDIAMRTISGVVSGSATGIYASAFAYCSEITAASFPNATTIGSSAFFSCSKLTTASFPRGASFGSQCFRNCQRLESLYVLASSVATLKSSAFLLTPMVVSSYLGHFGSIYVPASLVDSYKTATNWSVHSARITAYEG